MSLGDLAALVFWLLLLPLVVPFGLILTSVPSTVLGVVGARRYLARPDDRPAASRPWYLLAAATLSLHTLLLLVLLWVVADQTWSVGEALLPFAWVCVQDVVTARALLRASRHRRAFLDRHAPRLAA